MQKNKHFHFVGIGGIGMSAIATILKKTGYTVSGCDPDLSQNTIQPLRTIGCAVYEGNNTAHCNDNSIDTLVYIPMYEHTITSISSEIKQARECNITTITRAQMLAELMKTKYGIAVAGSHGKTTTSALIAHILLEAHYDPTIVIGGILKNISSNAHLGFSDFFVIEADESDRSFLQLNPTMNVITNIDIEHLETYKDLDDIKQTFAQFIKNIPAHGKTIVCIDDEHTRALINNLLVDAQTYGITHEADIYARDINLFKEYSTFSVWQKNHTSPLGIITLPIPGLHNIYNALGAITASLEIKVPFDAIANALMSFSGVDRRFSFHGTCNGADVFDDYGHHPKEIECVISVARKRTKNKLIVVFQPHRYTRTKELWNDFLIILNNSTIDKLIITDIYSAGEAPIDGITSEKLVHELQLINNQLSVDYIKLDNDFAHLIARIKQYASLDDLILLLGAGKMHLLAPLLIN